MASCYNKFITKSVKERRFISLWHTLFPIVASAAAPAKVSAPLTRSAPATANTIAKMRYGIADNLVTSVLLATKARIVVAPAMNTGMWENPVTQENIAALKARGVTIVEPDSGELACGATGKGRMIESEEIFKICVGG